LYESLYHAYKLGINEEVLECISETETGDFIESANSRIVSAAFHSKRRAEEMDEVVKFLSEYQNPVMAQATSKFFKNLSETIKKPSKRPENYTDIYKLLYKE